MNRTGWKLRAILYRMRFSHVGIGSEIGRPLYLQGAGKISVGDHTEVYPGARLETYGEGRIRIGDHVSVGQNFHCTAASDLSIGNGTTVAGNVFVTDIDHEYRNADVHILKQPMLVSRTSIGESCHIGYGAAIQAGTGLGSHCVVAPNAVVRGTFPDGVILAGAPARIVGRYDAEKGSWENADGND